MSVSNPYSITYDSRTVGGSSSTYQLNGPYVFDHSYDSFRVVFDVIVVASSTGGLQSASEDLQDDFRKRLRDGDSFSISMSGASWSYTVGETALKVRSSIAKSGNPDTDRGYSRAYTVTIEGELPADDSTDAGLRDIEALVDFSAARQKTVTIRGTYTATTAGDAKARYEADGDSVSEGYLDAIDSGATWELADESYSMDREGPSGSPAPHVLNFTRQYVQLLADQSQGSTDDTQIKDHRITFTDMGQYPGDSSEEADRLRRVVGSYDCAVDIEQTTNLQSVYENQVKDHLRELFRSNFNPAQFAAEDERISYDETNKRISVSFQFIYQPAGGEAIVEVAQSVAYREVRNIDYTPTHEDDEFAHEADVGFAIAERIWNRTVIVIGQETPKTRLKDKAQAGPAGKFDASIGGEQGPDSGDTTKVNKEGWNVVSSTSQVTPRWLGNPNGEERIEVSVLTESVVERFHNKPGNRTSTPIPGGSGPITPGGSS